MSIAGRTSVRITIRHIEAEGFFHGSQGTAIEPMLAQIAAQSEQERAALRARAVRGVKTLEARIAATTEGLRAFQARQLLLAEKTRGETPQMLRAQGGAALAALAVMGEVILLAPVMDGFGIADRGLQHFAALVFVLVSSGLVHLLTTRMRRAAPATVPRERRWTTVLVTAALAALTFGLLLVLGWWRGSEMLFAAEAMGGEWAAFLASCPTLTRVCVMLLTLALPIFAAVVGEAASKEIALAWSVLTTEHALARESERLHRFTKRHEAEEVKLAETLGALSQEEERLRNVYLEHHELGTRLGAKRQPVALLVLRCAAVALLLALACVVIDPVLATHIDSGAARGFLYGLVVAGLSGLHAAHAWRAWERPTPTQLFRARALRWREDPPTPATPPRSERAAVPVLLGRGGRADRP
jgi:hypothetical protein